jgi:hypothetical protein
MTLTVRLDEQEEFRLQQIAELTNSSTSAIIRQLINEKWTSLGAQLTFVERRGGHPENLLDGRPDLSQRSVRKSALTEHMVKKAKSRKVR